MSEWTIFMVIQGIYAGSVSITASYACVIEIVLLLFIIVLTSSQ